MKVTYTGKTKDFTPQFEKKVDAKLTKLGKMIEQRGEKEAHVFHRQERHLHKVDIKGNFYDHSLSGAGADIDLMNACCVAIEKLEKQIVKLRSRWRDTHRDPKSARANKDLLVDGAPTAVAVAPVVKATKLPKPVLKTTVDGKSLKPKVFRVNHGAADKPMTLEEAILEMEGDVDYFVYRDSGRSTVSVLLRRRDGHFDLVEG